MSRDIYEQLNWIVAVAGAGKAEGDPIKLGDAKRSYRESIQALGLFG